MVLARENSSRATCVTSADQLDWRSSLRQNAAPATLRRRRQRLSQVRRRVHEYPEGAQLMHQACNLLIDLDVGTSGRGF